ncbi:hypothetical protein AZL_a08980 (plasmid) [Azospirillum sp. B510]|uniref:SphA family protein n=1 Tax=Azospirillum sp. (strain B510) TaxID=137722 RepID=UPI0001C4BBBA|nr:transporter [Azospirillum sp. B510]BAI74429.1 hypothetical protein AZL_a08980 [Azospirillum sp. B510]
MIISQSMDRVWRPIAAAATILAGLAASPALATENGGPTTPFGVFEFGAGILPPPTPYGTVGLRTNFYSASSVKDGAGNTRTSDFGMHVLSIAGAYVKMTDLELLGANVGFGGVLPFLDMGGHLTVPTPGGPLTLKSQTFKLGDIQVYPLMLQWKAKSLFVNAYAQVQAPTGSYDVKRLFNPGSNHWSFAPVVAATYITDSGFEVSSNFELDINTTNHKTDYRSGMEFKHEFAAGQHFGPVVAGLGGYWYQQVSDDHGPGSGDGRRARVFGLGPAVNYFEPGMPLIALHAYKEFGARNRAQGYATALRIGYSF